MSAINQNKTAASLFLDFSKAFDLVDHSILTHKFKLYNIGTSWISSYLNKRFLQTHHAGAISDKKEVISGVPQGSFLWPILFLIYVNDLPLSLTSTCIDIFAGDPTIITSSHSIDTLVET